MTSLVQTGAGAYAPIPPVFNPTSPSPILLWSCAAGKALIVYPSENARMESSGPSRYSSMTISSPAAPNSLSTKTAFNACSASCLVSGKSTPFPAANPEAFRTTRSNPHEARYARASSYWEAVNDRKPAVGIAWRSIKSLESVLEPSRSAASGEGPKTGIPAGGGLAMLQRGRPRLTFSEDPFDAVYERLFRAGNTQVDLGEGCQSMSTFRRGLAWHLHDPRVESRS